MIRTMIAACLAALAVAAPASAWHAMADYHFPTTSVEQNGGYYTAAGNVRYGGNLVPIGDKLSSPCRPECRFLKVIDRTGFGFAWHARNVLYPALAATSDASGNRVVFTTSLAERKDIRTAAELTAAKHTQPLGTITIYRLVCCTTPQISNGAGAVSCDDPAYPEVYRAQPYCGTVNLWKHKASAQIIITEPSGLGQQGRQLVTHELGHAALSLLDTYIYPDCGVSLGGDVSIMCSLSYGFFSAHDRDAVDLVFSHSDTP